MLTYTLEEVINELRQVEQITATFEDQPTTHQKAKRAVDAQKRLMKLKKFVNETNDDTLRDRWLRDIKAVMTEGFDIADDFAYTEKPAKKASAEIKPIFANMENPFSADWQKHFGISTKHPKLKPTAKMYKGATVTGIWYDEIPPTKDEP